MRYPDLRTSYDHSTGNRKECSQSPDAGFSLLEMLVAMAIAAAMATVIFLNAPSGKLNLTRETDQLSSRLARARDVAVLKNRPVLIEFGVDGYRASEKSRSGWVSIADSGATPWEDGTSFALGDGLSSSTIAFDSIGLTEPVEITLFRDGRAERIDVDGSGNIRRRVSAR